jgi:lipopolysaccharide/colanic/teichoic acid biosynthesis glycosyltransferase
VTIDLPVPLDRVPRAPAGRASAWAARPGDRLRPRLRRGSKRLLDLIGATAILLRLDGGRAFYVQRRIGRGGIAFSCLKFRTMVPDADAALGALLERDPAAAAEWLDRFKLKDDPRVTALGRFLRATSLDELPQLFNILRGEMSLVGPRPIVEDEIQRYGEEIALYCQVRPGLTGLWQVSGRNDLAYAERVRLDAAYVGGWTLRGDVAILLKTVPVVIRGAGAY